MPDELSREESRYYRMVLVLNQISFLVAFLPPLFAVFVGIELADFSFILPALTSRSKIYPV